MNQLVPYTGITGQTGLKEIINRFWGPSARSAWDAVRTLVGDNAYERYCMHRARVHPNEPLLDRKAFYLRNQTEKWSNINRCC